MARSDNKEGKTSFQERSREKAGRDLTKGGASRGSRPAKEMYLEVLIDSRQRNLKGFVYSGNA